MPVWLAPAIGAAASLVGNVLGQQGLASARQQAQDFASQAKVPIKEEAFNIRNAQQTADTAMQRSDTAAQQADVANQQRQQLIQQLQQQAAGQGPSLATAQLKAAQDRNLAQQLAAAASRQNAGPLGVRTLMRQQGEAGAQLAQQANQAQMQEAMQAREQLGTQVNQQEQLANQIALQYMQQGFNVDQAQAQAAQALQQLRVQQALGAGQIGASALGTTSQANTGLTSALMGGLSGALSAFGGGKK